MGFRVWRHLSNVQFAQAKYTEYIYFGVTYELYNLKHYHLRLQSVVIN